MKALAIIGARLNSNRLPGKHLYELAGKPLIQRLCERLRTCTEVDDIVLATTDDSFNTKLMNWAEGFGIKCLAFNGDVNDLVGRINAVVEAYQPSHIVYVCGDCPLIDPGFIDHALSALKSNKVYDVIGLEPGTRTLHEGLGFYSLRGWKKLAAASTTATTREHVGYAHRQKPFLKTLYISDSGDFSKIEHRISVDTAADLKFMQEVYTRWYLQHHENTIVDLKWVQEQLLDDPELRSMNLHVTQKRPDQQYDKVSLYCHASREIGLGHLRRISNIANALQAYLGLGTIIHIHGEQKQLEWLHSKTLWHAQESELIARIERDENSLIILDFHPNFIDLSTLCNALGTYRKNSSNRIIALDKLDALLPLIDRLFIPSFFCKLDSPKVSYGWDHYFLDKTSKNSFEKQITILTGGSDALGLGETLPALIEPVVPNEWKLIWIQGPYAPSPHLKTHQRWHCYQDPKDLQTIIASSLIVLSTYGLSLFESIANAGSVILLPPQHLCSNEELQALEQSHTCIINRELEQVPSKLAHLISDPEQRQKLRKNAERLFSRVNGLKLLSDQVKQLLEEAKT